MSAGGGKTSRAWEPQRDRQQAQSPASKLPAGDLVFVRLDMVPKVALSRFDAPEAQETRRGPPLAPAMMVCLLLDADGGGVFSSRTMALACERHGACRAMVGEERPDLRTLRDWRTWPLEACQAVWVQGVRCAGAAGWVPGGTVSTDGTTRQGPAARPKAMSDGERPQAGDRLRAALAAWGTPAYGPDEAADAV